MVRVGMAREMVVGSSLMVAGVMMAVVGLAVDRTEVASVVPVLGAALLCAGLVIFLDAHGRARPKLPVGVALVAAGTSIAVTGGLVGGVAVANMLPAVGAAIVAAGLIDLVRATLSAGRASREG